MVWSSSAVEFYRQSPPAASLLVPTRCYGDTACKLMNTASCNSGICHREILDWFPTSRSLNIGASGWLSLVAILRMNAAPVYSPSMYFRGVYRGNCIFALFPASSSVYFTMLCFSALTVDGRMTDGGSERMWQQIVIFRGVPPVFTWKGWGKWRNSSWRLVSRTSFWPTTFPIYSVWASVFLMFIYLYPGRHT